MHANWLLNDLSPDCLDFLGERAMVKPIAAGELLFEANAPIQNLIFALDGIISVQARAQDGRTVENFLMGRDGVIGSHYLLGFRRSPSRAVTVISGRACWIPVAIFEEANARFPCIRPALAACMLRVFQRMAQNILCASYHTAQQRIASWLLHADDRLEREKFDLTQRALSDILGLRAATVSEAYNRLLALGAIRHSRGNLQILDRAMLKAQTCECYDETCLERQAKLVAG